MVLRDAQKGLTPVEVSNDLNITEGSISLTTQSAKFTNGSPRKGKECYRP